MPNKNEQTLEESTFLKAEIVNMIVTRYGNMSLYTTLGVLEIVKSILIERLDHYEGNGVACNTEISKAIREEIDRQNEEITRDHLLQHAAERDEKFRDAMKQYSGKPLFSQEQLNNAWQGKPSVLSPADTIVQIIPYKSTWRERIMDAFFDAYHFIFP